jgi:hypothetical protein
MKAYKQDLAITLLFLLLARGQGGIGAVLALTAACIWLVNSVIHMWKDE